MERTVSKSEIIAAFHACIRAEAALATLQISKRGDVNKAFYKFYEDFKVVYQLALNNTKFREVKYNKTPLAEGIQDWFDKAKDRKDADDGRDLFREFNLAVGRLGLLI